MNQDVTHGRSRGPGELDEEAVARLRAGDRRALNALVESYQDRVYHFAARMCRDPEDARDVVQETFLAALRGVRRFRGEARLSTWLFRIAANACRKLRRRARGEPERVLSLEELPPMPDELREPAPDDETPERHAAGSELRRALQAAIGALPAAYREVLLLRDVEGLSTEATAAALGLGVPAVKTRLHRARLFVRRSLAEHLGP